PRCCVNGDAPESSHAPRRPDCGSRAGACLRQPWLPPRRPRTHPSALSGQALDRVSARVPRLAPRAAHAAGSLHGALLPGRGDALLCWTSRGYCDAVRLPRHTDARVVTPPSLVALLRHAREPLVPLLHPSAIKRIA